MSTLSAPAPAASEASRPGWDDRLIDISLLLLVLVAPLVLGGRHPAGKWALALAALPGTTGLLSRVLRGRRLPLAPPDWIVLTAVAALPLLQTLPLGTDTVMQLAPGWRGLFTDPAAVLAPESLASTPSLSAVTTSKRLPLGIVYVAIVVFTASRLRTLADAEWLLKLLLLSGLLLASVALLQANFGNGKFLWLYDHPTREPGTIPRGPFQNENHLSSLLATILPAALYFLFAPQTPQPSERRSSRRGSRGHGHQRRRRHSSRRTSSGLNGVAFGLGGSRPLAAPVSAATLGERLNPWQLVAAATCLAIVTTVYATPSRGGAAVVALAAACWGGALGWWYLGYRLQRRVSFTRWRGAALLCGTAGVIAAFGLLATQIERLSYWRAQLWSADLAIWRDFPWLGVGIGNHRHIYRAYLDDYFFQTFSTAESSWLTILVEAGLVGIAVASLVAWRVLAPPWRMLSPELPRRQLLLTLSLLAGLGATLFHAIVDFPWHIPACLTVVLLLTAAAIRLPALCRAVSRGELPGESRGERSTVVVTGVTGVTGGDGGDEPAGALGRGASLGLAWSSGVATLLLLGNLWALQRAWPEVRAAAAWDEYRRLARDSDGEEPAADVRRLTAQLAETLRHDPDHVRARAAWLLRQTAHFERRRFQLAQPRAVAEQLLAQCRAVARRSPTDSRAYFCAAVLGEALTATPEQTRSHLQQAQRLRRVDGHVALKLAVNALLTGQNELADRQFLRALEVDPSFRQQAVAAVSGIYPPAEMVARWPLSRDTSAELYRVAKTRFPAEQQQAVGRHFCGQLIVAADSEPRAMAQHLLSAAFTVAREIDAPRLQLRIVDRRLELDPHNVNLLLDRAAVHRSLHAFKLARRDVQKGLSLAPDNRRARQLAWEIDRQSRNHVDASGQYH